MARLNGAPAAWHELPADLAAGLGLAIAGFGHLEDMLKRTLFALARDRLAGELRDHDFRQFLARMEDVAADSLGTLIERLARALDRADREDRDLIEALDEVRNWRNLLCHAAWQPAPGGGWQPIFANTRGEVFEGRIDGLDLRAIRELTLDCARRAERIILAVDDGDTLGTGD